MVARVCTCVCRGLPEHGLQRGPAGLPGEAAGGHVNVRGEQVHDRRGHRRDHGRHRGRRRRRQGAAQAVARRTARGGRGDMRHGLVCAVGGWYIFCVLGVGWWRPGRLAEGPGCVGSHGGLCSSGSLGPAKTYDKIYEIKKSWFGEFFFA